MFEPFVYRLKIRFYRISLKAWAGQGLDRRLVVGGEFIADSDNADINAANLPIGTNAEGPPANVLLSSAGSNASRFRGSETLG